MNDLIGKKRICIVDGYSSGSDLAKHLAKRGVALFHLQSSENISPAFLKTYNPSFYACDLGIFSGKWCSALEAQLAGHCFDHVIAGTETGVSLAELIAQRLSLPSNELSSIVARRDKFEMIKSVREAGLLTASHVLCANREEVETSLEQIVHFPVVVKPTRSAGSDSVVIAKSRQSASLAAEAILGRKNQLGEENSHCVIESFLAGAEYIVDLIIKEDVVVVCDICCSQKSVSAAGHPCYDFIELVDFHDPDGQACLQYTRACLEPLGLRFGAVHAELKMTASGPALIEIGARLAGAGLPRTFQADTNNSSIGSYIDLLVAPERFAFRSQSTSQLRNYCCIVFLNAPARGTLLSVPRLEEFGALESEVTLEWSLQPGDRVQPTSDIFSAPGVLVLRSSDPKSLGKDRRVIRSLEHQIFEKHVESLTH